MYYGSYVLSQEAKSVIDALNEAWNWRMGFPSVGFWADNGLEFKNKEMAEYASKFGFKINFGPTYSPLSKENAKLQDIMKESVFKHSDASSCVVACINGEIQVQT